MKQVKFTRQELYDLVWSESMLSLAKEYAISDVGLRKKCRNLEIPLPNNGYWAKVQYGKKVIERRPLGEFKGEQTVVLTLREDEEGTKEMSHAAVQKLIESDTRINLAVPERLTNADKMIVALRDYLYRKDVMQGNDRIISGTRSELDISVSPKLISRALRFMDTLIKALRSRGHDVVIKNNGTFIVAEGEEFKVYCSERLVPIENAALTRGQVIQYMSILSLSVKISWNAREWRDGKKQLEEQLSSIIATIEIKAKKLNEERIENEKQWKIQEEKNRIAKELQQRKDRELLNFKEIFKKAKRHEKAEIIRRYAAELERSSIARNELTNEVKRLIAWTMLKADWYDPFIEADDELLRDVDKEDLTFKKKSWWG